MKKQILISLFLLLHLSNYSLQSNQENSPIMDTLKYLTDHYQYHKALEFIEKQDATRNMLIKKAQCYKSIGDYNKASSILSDLVEQYPDDIHILNELALLYQASKRWEDSEKYYSQLIELDSTNVFYKTKKADMLYNQSKYNEAINIYTLLHLENPTSSRFIKQLGLCHESINKKDSAQLYYNQAWEQDFTDSQAAVLYTNFLLKQKNIPSALKVCRTYMEIDSINFQINRLHALSYYMIGNYAKAATLFEQCLSNGDSTSVVNQNLGLSYFSLKDPRAYEVLHKAYAQDTTNNSVLYGLAAVCNDLKKTDEAINYFSVLLERVLPQPNVMYLYYRGLAIALSDNKEYKSAITHFKEALRYGNKNQQMMTQIAIAELYDMNLKDNKNALKHYKLFRTDLENYITRLKEEETIDSKQVNDAEQRLKSLNQYIKELNDSL